MYQYMETSIAIIKIDYTSIYRYNPYISVYIYIDSIERLYFIFLKEILRCIFKKRSIAHNYSLTSLNN